jgi:NitT/TauT family transport system substrate-binding protein
MRVKPPADWRCSLRIRSPGFQTMAILRFGAALRAAALLSLAAALASCSWHEPEPLRIGISDWPPFEFLHLAREKGFFEEEGVQVRLIEFASMSDARRAFEHRQIDGGLFSIFETLHVRANSVRGLKVPLVIDFSDGADAILARPGIADIGALRGKRLGIDLGALGVYVADRALNLHGLSLDDVTVVSVEDIDMLHYLEEDRVDAVVNYPPTRTNIESKGLARAIFTSRQIPGEIVDVLALDETVIEERSADVARLIRAFYRAVDYARAHPDEAYAIMAKREHLEVADFRAALESGITLVPLADQERFLAKGSPFTRTVAEIARVMHARGQIRHPGVAEHLLHAGPAALAASGD